VFLALFVSNFFLSSYWKTASEKSSNKPGSFLFPSIVWPFPEPEAPNAKVEVENPYKKALT
jgi:hypothetical protein